MYLRTMGGTGASPVGGKFYIVKDGVINPDIIASGASYTYDAVNGRLTVSPDSVNRYLNFSPSLTVSGYINLKATIMSTSAANYAELTAKVDGNSIAPMRFDTANVKTTLTSAINGDTMTNLSVVTVSNYANFYLYDLWIEQ